MRAGQLNSRIILQKPVHTPSSFGDLVTTYADVATVWSAIDWGSGRRFEAAKQLNAEVQGVIRIRYRSDVKADWRIGYGGRTIVILSIANVKEKDAEIWFNCKEAQD
jgi:SPP1 family predicted phage head-tail adaptor